MDLLSLDCPIRLSVHRRLFGRKVELRPEFWLIALRCARVIYQD